jgi:hypothetical protein
VKRSRAEKKGFLDGISPAGAVLIGAVALMAVMRTLDNRYVSDASASAGGGLTALFALVEAAALLLALAAGITLLIKRSKARKSSTSE